MNAMFAKWGNSVALRIPTSIVQELSVFVGKQAKIRVQHGSLVVTPVPGPVYTLDELLDGMTEENLHGEIPTGRPVGNEAW